MAKGLSYLALGVAAGVALVAASEGALQAAAFGGDRLTLFNDVFNTVRDNYANSSESARPRAPLVLPPSPVP
jgi:hypothetical protein